MLRNYAPQKDIPEKKKRDMNPPRIHYMTTIEEQLYTCLRVLGRVAFKLNYSPKVIGDGHGPPRLVFIRYGDERSVFIIFGANKASELMVPTKTRLVHICNVR